MKLEETASEVLKKIFMRARRLVSVPSGNPELLRAQFEVFSNQLPLMYSIVLVNAWALAFIFIQEAPVWLSLWIPGGLSLVCCVRLFGWWRSRHVVPSPEAARKALTRTNQFSLLLTVALSAWALSLFPYGDAYARGNIAFFVAITGLGVIICLQQLPSAAFIVAIVINAAFVTYFSFVGLTSFVVMAINLALVSIALLLVVKVQYRHFSSAVRAHTKLEAANRENARLANLDSLTGLPNRRQFFTHLETVFAESGGKRLAVVTKAQAAHAVRAEA